MGNISMTVEDHWRFASSAAAQARVDAELRQVKQVFRHQPTVQGAAYALHLLRPRMCGVGYSGRLRRLLDELVGWHKIDYRVRACIEAWAEDEREKLP